jgi:phosphoglycolate phosphatase
MKLLVFDWDGTLIDSSAKIVDCMQLAALDASMPALSEAAVLDIIGLGLPEAIRKMFPGISDDDLGSVKEHYARRFVAADQIPCDFFPGVQDCLHRLRDDGYRLAVATGKSRVGLNRMLANTGLAGFFDATRCADETASKPHPLMLEQLLGELEVAASDACMVGDTEYDLMMANHAGVAPVAVTYGVHSTDRLQACKPVATLDVFSDIEVWMNSRLD